MNTRKTYNFLGFFAFILFMVTACSNIFEPPVQIKNNKAVDPVQKNIVRIFAGESKARERTIQPGKDAIAGYRFTVDNGTYKPADVTGVNYADLYLADGSWTITAKAYKQGGTIGNSADAVASGTINITVTNGAVSGAAPNIVLKPIGTGNGTLSYTITGGASVTGYVKLWDEGGTPVSGFGTGGSLSVTNSVTADQILAAGRYTIEVKLTDTAGKIAFRREVVEIWAGTTSVFGFNPSTYVEPYPDPSPMPDALKGTWVSMYGEEYIISDAVFSTDTGYGGYAGTVVGHRSDSPTSGYITIQYTSNDTYTDVVGNYYVIYYSDLSALGVKIAGAYSAADSDSGKGKASQTEAEAAYMVFSGYFSGNSDCYKIGKWGPFTHDLEGVWTYGSGTTQTKLVISDTTVQYYYGGLLEYVCDIERVVDNHNGTGYFVIEITNVIYQMASQNARGAFTVLQWQDFDVTTASMAVGGGAAAWTNFGTNTTNRTTAAEALTLYNPGSTSLGNRRIFALPVTNVRPPTITAQPAASTSWNVSSVTSVSLTVTATPRDSGTLTYQWYENATASASGGTAVSGGTGATLTLAKANYDFNAAYYFYVVVTNTNNNAGGTKSATATSTVATVTVTGSANTGTAIRSSADIASIGSNLNGTYVLLNNVSVTNHTPIGSTATPFTGKFNGNNKTITLNGFTSAALSANTHLGLFASVKGASSSAKAEIKNLKIQAALPAGTKTTTGNRIGLVAGEVQDAVIENITLSGAFNLESSILVNLGGIAGNLTGAGTVVKDCESTMDMYIIPGSGGGGSYSYIGGFVGQFTGGAGVENCHYNGNITADNISSSAGAGQTFAGGIANSSYGFVTAYQGYIQDCSFTGTLLAKNGGSWTFAGGIAACNVGGTVNDYSQTTRIVRCYVEGTVSSAGTTAGYPYIGGIVGYNYYGALVSQCYFNGTVIAAKVNDYTGGIAGYNSQTTAPNNSRVEDCWSAGLVQGFNNAGGIVGQNQVNTYIRRCYSTMEVATTNGASGVGGIAGLNASNQTDAVTACVALNVSIHAPAGNNINRVTGTTTGIRSNCYGWENMPVTTGGTYTQRIGDTLAGGENCDQKPAQSFYTDLNWDFSTVWKMGSDGYPKLQWQN